MPKKPSVGKTIFKIALPLAGAALTAGIGMPWLGALIGSGLAGVFDDSLDAILSSIPENERRKIFKELITKPADKLGDGISGVLSNGAYDLLKSHFKDKKSTLNYDFPRVLVRVWIDAIEKMLDKGAKADLTLGIDRDNEFDEARKTLLTLWQSKLNQALSDNPLLWELFANKPDYFLETAKGTSNFIDKLSDENQTADYFWQILESSFTDWARKAGEIPSGWGNRIRQNLAEELRTKLFRNFSSRLKNELKDSPRAWISFQYAVSEKSISLIQTLEEKIDIVSQKLDIPIGQLNAVIKDLTEIKIMLPVVQRAIILRLDDFEKELNKSLDKRFENQHQRFVEFVIKFFQNASFSFSPQEKVLFDATVKPLLEKEPSEAEVIKYLEKLAKEAAEVPKYYPERLRENKDGETIFDDIRQTVEVVADREMFQKEIAKMRESLHSAGIFTDVFAYKSSKARIDRPEEFSFDAAKSEKIEPPMDWDEAREKFPRAVILGDPGFGKSWLLRYEARQLATAQKTKLENDEITAADVTLPILTRLTNLAQHAKNKTVAEGLAVAVCPGEKAETSAFREWVKQKIEREECVILLDALDEVPEKPENQNESLSRAELLKKLEIFSADYPKMRILLTSRSVGYLGSPFKDGKKLELTAFEQTQIENFVGKFFSDKTKAEKFLTTIEDRPQIKGLSQIPLMLGLLCRCFEENEKPEDFSEHRVELYDKCLRGLLREWKEEKRGISVRDVNSIIRMLSKISYELFPKQQFAESKSDELILECLEDSPKGDPISELNTAQIIERLEADGILVVAQKSGDPQYIFLHRTFQEYLTAFCLAKREDYQAKALAKIYDSDWTEVLRLLGGTLKEQQANEYIEALSAKNAEDILQRPFHLAVFAAAEADKHLAENLADELFTKSINAYLKPPYSLPQEWFAPVAKSWTKRTTEFFREWLQINQSEIDEDKRDRAIRSVGELKLNALIPDLIKILDDSNASPRFRGDVARVLAKMKVEKAIDKLIKILSDEQIYWVSDTLTIALAKMKVEKAIDKLIEMLSDDQIYVGSRVTVAKALAEMKVEKAIDKLIEMLSDKQISGWIDGDVARELVKMKVEKVIDKLIEMLSDEQISTSVRVTVAKALVEMKVEKAIDKLIEMLSDKQIDAWVRGNVAKALVKMKVEKAIDKLIEMLSDEQIDAWVRGGVVIELANMKLEQKQIDKLIKTLSDKQINDWIHGKVAKALAEMKVEKVIDKLIEMLSDKQIPAGFRGILARVLAELKVEKAIDKLIEMLSDKQTGVLFRYILAKALAEMKVEKAIDKLIEMLSDEQISRWVRGNVARALLKLGVEIKKPLPPPKSFK